MSDLEKWLRRVRQTRREVRQVIEDYVPREDDPIVHKNLKRAINGLDRAAVGLEMAEWRVRKRRQVMDQEHKEKLDRVKQAVAAVKRKAEVGRAITAAEVVFVCDLFDSVCGLYEKASAAVDAADKAFRDVKIMMGER